jgi:hypothetical protein
VPTKRLKEAASRAVSVAAEPVAHEVEYLAEFGGVDRVQSRVSRHRCLPLR